MFVFDLMYNVFLNFYMEKKKKKTKNNNNNNYCIFFFMLLQPTISLIGTPEGQLDG